MRPGFAQFGLVLPALLLAGLALTLTGCGKVEAPAPHLVLRRVATSAWNPPT